MRSNERTQLIRMGCIVIIREIAKLSNAEFTPFTTHVCPCARSCAPSYVEIVHKPFENGLWLLLLISIYMAV